MAFLGHILREMFQECMMITTYIIRRVSRYVTENAKKEKKRKKKKKE